MPSHELVIGWTIIMKPWTLAIKNNKNTMPNVKRTTNVMEIELVPSSACAMESVTANINLGLFDLTIISNLAGNK